MEYLPSALRLHGRDRVHDLEKDGMSGSTLPIPSSGAPPPLTSQPTILKPEAMHQLATFRHMVGIHSTKGSVPTPNSHTNNLFNDNSNHLHFDGRAAPNLGIYNRVCHREAQAKRGYKFAALFINGCLGVQIIVAAALTAMGAANSNHKGITAFGAINTVIAGILTYLKGSGLPNRIRYYENEWKKVREFIEQRERDFGRPDCMLDINQVVDAIEAMYEQVKADVATNTPDSYVSVTTDVRARTRAVVSPGSGIRGVGLDGAGKGRNKLEELQLKYGYKVTDFLESLAHKEEERLRRIEGDVDRSKARALAALQEGRSAVHGGREQWDRELENAKISARDWERDMEDKGVRVAEKELQHAKSGASDWEKEMEAKGAAVAQREIEHARSGPVQRGLDFARNANHARVDLLHLGDDIAKDLDAARAAALQRGRDYEKEVDAKTARLAEAGRDLKKEVERAQEQAAQQAANSIHRVADTVQRTGEDDEIQLHR